MTFILRRLHETGPSAVKCLGLFQDHPEFSKNNSLLFDKNPQTRCIELLHTKHMTPKHKKMSVRVMEELKFEKRKDFTCLSAKAYSLLILTSIYGLFAASQLLYTYWSIYTIIVIYMMTNTWLVVQSSALPFCLLPCPSVAT